MCSNRCAAGPRAIRFRRFSKNAAESLYPYYTKEQEERYGVLGIEIKCLTP